MGFLKRDDGSSTPEPAAPAAPRPDRRGMDLRSAGRGAARRRLPGRLARGAAGVRPRADRADEVRTSRGASSRATCRSTSSCSSRRPGFEPLGLVLGSSIYHIGFQQSMWNQSQEMGVLTQAMYHARELAMTRMEEEADQLGADGDRRRPPRRSAATTGAPISPSSSPSAPRSSTARASCTAPRTAGRSPPTSADRTSRRCCAPGTDRSGS